MNFLYTSHDPYKIAVNHCLIHRNSQIKEHCQLMSTAHRLLGSDVDDIYQMTHQFHPTAVWVRKSSQHYRFMWKVTKIMCQLHRDFTGNDHGCEEVLDLLKNPPAKLENNGYKPPPVAAPDRFKALVKTNGVPFAYQRYLNSKFREWTRRDNPIFAVFEEEPNWFVPNKLWLRNTK